MASHYTGEGASALPLHVMLAAIPSYPRPVLSRLVGHMIDRLDDLDGDPDLEPGDEDEEHDGREPEDAGAQIIHSVAGSAVGPFASRLPMLVGAAVLQMSGREA